ncbi:putative ATP-grasp-modified RiPP [Streptosporangium sp. NPDC000563]|uniref:putative ATP-grasp-modified RiPP n=1 Tax=Streptosporangium sp. NPDC000563 TaxID=3154366 RepID=UPI003320B3BC
MENPLGQPWGLTRSVPFALAEITLAVPYRVELDPVTQTGVHRDVTTGRLIEAGKHGTNKQTSRSQKTGGGGDGSAPQPSDQTTVTDYDTD